MGNKVQVGFFPTIYYLFKLRLYRLDHTPWAVYSLPIIYYLFYLLSDILVTSMRVNRHAEIIYS